jgi:hypothetical protein
VCWSGRFLPVNVQGLASAAACNSRLRSRRSFGFFLTRKSAKLANPMPCYSLSPWVAEEVRKCYNGLLDGENGSRPGALCSCNDLVDLRQKVVSWRADRSDDLALFQSVIQGGGWGRFRARTEEADGEEGRGPSRGKTLHDRGSMYACSASASHAVLPNIPPQPANVSGC